MRNVEVTGRSEGKKNRLINRVVYELAIRVSLARRQKGACPWQRTEYGQEDASTFQ